MKCPKCDLWYPSTERKCIRCGSELVDDGIKKDVPAPGFCRACGRPLGAISPGYAAKSICMICTRAGYNVMPHDPGNPKSTIWKH
jgi:hypothetical protein